MPIYSTYLGKVKIGIHFESNYRYFKMRNKHGVHAHMYDHPIVDVWPIGKDTFHEDFDKIVKKSDKFYLEEHLPVMIKRLLARFDIQKKPAKFIKEFFVKCGVSEQNIELAKNLDLKKKTEDGEQKAIGAAIGITIGAVPNDKMTKKELIKYCVDNDVIMDFNTLTKPVILEKAIEIHESKIPTK